MNSTYAPAGPYRRHTEKQLDLLERILTDNSLHEGRYETLWKELEAARVDDRTPGDGTPMDRSYASACIDWLTSQGYRPGGQQAGPRNDIPAAVGVYRKDDTLYVVREFTPQGEQRKVRYAREIMPLTGGQADRLNQQGDLVRIEERKAPGMQYKLTPADALPLEEVQALSVQWSHCLVCGKHIRVAKSVERGIGPVCYSRQSALLGQAA